MLQTKEEIKDWLLKGMLLGIGTSLALLSKETIHSIYDLIPKDMLDKVPKIVLLNISSLFVLPGIF